MITLKRATEADAARLYCWRQDRDVQQASFGPPPKDFVSHLTWFTDALSDKSRAIYIARDSQRSVVAGYVRLTAEPDGLTVSVAVDPQQRGRGYAQEMLQAGMEQGRLDFPSASKFRALIKHQNFASLRLFWSMGFRVVGEGRDCLVLEKP